LLVLFIKIVLIIIINNDDECGMFVLLLFP